MPDRRNIFLLTYMMAIAIPGSLSFNIETTDYTVYPGEEKDFFGYKVLQYKSSAKKGIIITAPLLDGSGGICSNENISCFRPEEIHLKKQTIPVKHLGLTIAANSSAEFTVCSPTVAHECYENSYLNSICYKITDQLKQVSNSTPSFQECKKKTVDLVFLFDGSASMTEAEFNKNKEFILDIIETLKNSSIKFAAIQFSTDYRKVFDFNDYEAGTALSKLKKEPHLKSLTNTHKALTYVLDNILEETTAGASLDATKVLVLITDGDPSDVNDRYKITERYNEKNIIRFVIAVKGAKLDKFETIASKPTKDYAFEIENYNGLKGILENFQKKIFKMEGTKVSLAEDMTNEMAQSGFTAVAYKDALILGSVGSYNWRGSLEVASGDDVTQLKVPEMLIDSYMGYSISVGEKGDMTLYFTGAPRYNHTGQVVLFTLKDKKITSVKRIDGTQIGSYFGAELCSVDIDSDKNTDFLLVGAPLFYHPSEKREGQLFVYVVTDKMELIWEQNVTVSSMGRFGTTISSISDLNGDGLRDVAVGAPLEDENSGAVYIYLGDGFTGMRSTFSQRITGREFRPGLRFFGQAIDGGIDMGEDDLPDIVIGSKGSVVVLRSRPVFNVVARLNFQPEEIKPDIFECVKSQQSFLQIFNLTACFDMTEATKSKQPAISNGLNISFTLDIDTTRQTSRGFFTDSNKKRVSNLIILHELKDKETCFDYPIEMPKCVENTISPVCIKLKFNQVDSKNANAVLNVDSKNMALAEVPFEKQCQDQCIADLVLDFEFSTPTLLVAEDSYFEVTVNLTNKGNISINTSLTMDHPDGLSFSKMELLHATKPIVHSCYDQEEVLNRTVCGISRPLYRSKSYATFKTLFHITTITNKREHDWDDTISMTFSGTSNNANVTKRSSMTKNISVQFEIQMAVILNTDTVNFLNFTTEDFAPKKLEIVYTVKNLGWKAFPVNVSLGFTTELDHNFEMNNYKVLVQENKTQCDNIQPSSCFEKKTSKIIKCDAFTLETGVQTQFKLMGEVHFKNLKDHAANMAFLKRYTGESANVQFQSFIHVDYDKMRYVLKANKPKPQSKNLQMSGEICPSENNKSTAQMANVRVEFIVPMDRQLIILTGVGLGLLLLILFTFIMFKMGCFKRRQLPNEDDGCGESGNNGNDPATTEASAAAQAPISQPKADSKSDQPSENKKLLEGFDTID